MEWYVWKLVRCFDVDNFDISNSGQIFWIKTP